MQVNEFGDTGTVGPIGPTTVNLRPIAGLRTRVAAGNFLPTLPFSTAYPGVGGTVPLIWDRALPYTIQAAGEGVTARWRLANMEIEILNTTPELDLSGSVVTAMMREPLAPPSEGYSAPKQNYVAALSHFTVRQASDRKTICKWVPTEEDLNWHYTIAEPATNTTQGCAGVYVFLNPGSKAASYEIRIYTNWEIAGSKFSLIATDKDMGILHDATVKATVDTVHGTEDSSLVGKAGRVAHELLRQANPYLTTAATAAGTAALARAHQAFYPGMPRVH